MKLCKCSVCGNIIEVINDSGVPVMCCGKPMEELIANTSDGALEKHVPVVEYGDGVLQVKVGSMEHPMVAEHFITMILVDTGKQILRANLKPGEKPEAKFALENITGKIHVYEYCNIHGLWKSDIEI